MFFINGTDKMDTQWISFNMFPYAIGFCPDAKAWNKIMREYKIIINPPEYPPSSRDANCTSFNRNDGSMSFSVITINEKFDQRELLGVLGLIAHECQHAIDQLMEAIGEKYPSEEFRAYAIQHFFMQISRAWARRAGRLKEITESRKAQGLNSLPKRRKVLKRS